MENQYTLDELDRIIAEQIRKLQQREYDLRLMRVKSEQLDREIKELEETILPIQKLVDTLEKLRHSEEDKIITDGLAKISRRRKTRERRTDEGEYPEFGRA